MPHDAPEHWHEPKDNAQKAGSGTFKRPSKPYDLFMQEQDIPIVRDFGVSKVQNLPLKPWKRMGGSGTFIQLFGTEGLWGCYLVEVPGGGALNIERHLYEEQFLVVEGRGSTEVWQEGGKKSVFEWQKGSLFGIPLNAYHRIINASGSPALLLAGTSAPNIMNLYPNNEFIFNNPFVFKDRFDGSDDYFKPNDDIVPDPVVGRALRRSNLVPDVINCHLPLDNQRAPGYRRIELRLADNLFFQFVGQFEVGRYSKAHAHVSAAVIICLRGKGYTITWPSSLGMHPFVDGKQDEVVRVDYEPIGLVSAAPMSGDWFHQHFGIGKEPLRFIAWIGPNNASTEKPGRPGTTEIFRTSVDVRDGGSAIPYDDEDPQIRKDYESALTAVGATSRMEEWRYRKPAEGEIRPNDDFIGA